MKTIQKIRPVDFLKKDCIIVLSNVKYFVFRVVVIHFFFKQPLWMVVWDISL